MMSHPAGMSSIMVAQWNRWVVPLGTHGSQAVISLVPDYTRGSVSLSLNLSVGTR